MKATGYVVRSRNYVTASSPSSLCVDPDMRKSFTAYREVLEDKLKNHHSNLGTLVSCEALQEKKRVCVSLGVLQNSHQQ